MRAFVAIDLPETICAELAILQHSLAVGRPVPAENLHLTFNFLGDQRDEALEDAHEALSAIRAPAFELQLCGVGTFGKRSAQVIFADVARCDALLDLAGRITRALRQAGLEFEKRRFRPHVTIARLPKILSASELAEVGGFLQAQAGFRGSAFSVTRFGLYRSTLLPRGAVHEGLATYPLSAF
ncbi:RNA 2',3'-cyclic phosphodiesterase [Aestuariicoccus sp. MJ-SS9]|uniref:RNA 2',3'-cyclic phosphodiesterase n=1 Tax=Aestuariicoccus sp. MJ-SS9 TaxID=3079855 RepID=UPI002912D8DD|nr:RNA 2',3'-cyclic phosphodiesterase [Aestuariicoccus sp. MJ-SS9]MDU8913770.1 RNA 2',3'-cyclic phosphodiesterase [Aestuariicoccus sp. MJ-SS9]